MGRLPENCVSKVCTNLIYGGLGEDKPQKFWLSDGFWFIFRLNLLRIKHLVLFMLSFEAGDYQGVVSDPPWSPGPLKWSPVDKYDYFNGNWWLCFCVYCVSTIGITHACVHTSTCHTHYYLYVNKVQNSTNPTTRVLQQSPLLIHVAYKATKWLHVIHATFLNLYYGYWGSHEISSRTTQLQPIILPSA